MMYREKATKGKRIQGMETLEYLCEHKKWMPFAAAFLLLVEAVIVPGMLLTGHLGYSAAVLWLSVGMVLLSLVLTGVKFLLALTFLVFEYIYLYRLGCQKAQFKIQDGRLHKRVQCCPCAVECDFLMFRIMDSDFETRMSRKARTASG